MNKALISFGLVLLGVFIMNLTFAQTTLEGVYIKEKTAARKPIPYQYLREADVMWSKTIWRKIDIREKMNLPIYYPTVPSQTRMSLIQLLLWGIDTQGLQAYDPGDPDYEFKRPITREEINDRFGASEQVKMIEDVETGQLIEQKVKNLADPSQVKEYMLKELWFFDKQRSVMEVRILGICPIRIFYKDQDVEQLEPQRKKIFWVYFPQARKIFANHETFNTANDAERMSFDDLFFKRFFSSYIVKESNAYNDRQIDAYTMGLESMLEAERVKENIFNFEHDLWEF
jgi:gliding motility associated protien GldN